VETTIVMVAASFALGAVTTLVVLAKVMVKEAKADPWGAIGRLLHSGEERRPTFVLGEMLEQLPETVEVRYDPDAAWGPEWSVTLRGDAATSAFVGGAQGLQGTLPPADNEKESE
jgi:hypothetical protein